MLMSHVTTVDSKSVCLQPMTAGEGYTFWGRAPPPPVAKPLATLI